LQKKAPMRLKTLSRAQNRTPRVRARRPEELVGFRAMLTRTPRQGYSSACGALKRADLRPYAGFQAPTVCVVGDKRGSAAVELVRETAALIKGSRFEVVESAGHLPDVEKPGVVAGMMAEHAMRATL
jgi:3-oxoadipate enol-lactonase